MKITREYYEELKRELELRKAARNAAIAVEAKEWRAAMHEADEEAANSNKAHN